MIHEEYATISFVINTVRMRFWMLERDTTMADSNLQDTVIMHSGKGNSNLKPIMMSSTVEKITYGEYT